MKGKIIIIALILIICLGLMCGCRNIIKTGWYPHMWNFKIEGIEAIHLPDSRNIFGFYIHNYYVPEQGDYWGSSLGRGKGRWGSTFSVEASQYFDRGKTYGIELIINNENVEDGRYEHVDTEEKVKEIEQKYYTSVDSGQYSKYEYKTVTWQVKFIP